MMMRRIAMLGFVLVSLAFVDFVIAKQALMPTRRLFAQADAEQLQSMPWRIPRVSHYEIQTDPEGKVFYSPGFYDKNSDTFYRWKGITFPAMDSPYKSPYRQMLTLNPREEKYRQVDFDPPIGYLMTAPDALAPGYYVPNQQVFYRWKDVSLKLTELPQPKENPPVVISEKDRNTTLVVAVPPPQHLLAKPELWKKMENKK